jgi:hypothetical protein
MSLKNYFRFFFFWFRLFDPFRIDLSDVFGAELDGRNPIFAKGDIMVIGKQLLFISGRVSTDNKSSKG